MNIITDYILIKIDSIDANVHCYISVAEKHKTMIRFMTENNKYKQIIELKPITAIEYSSCYVMYYYGTKF